MITSTSSSDHSAPLGAPAATEPQAARLRAIRPDQISTASAAALQAGLARQPEIRPEVVARARALAADPSYPSPAVIQKIAHAILAAPDLSEDES